MKSILGWAALTALAALALGANIHAQTTSPSSTPYNNPAAYNNPANLAPSVANPPSGPYNSPTAEKNSTAQHATPPAPTYDSAGSPFGSVSPSTDLNPAGRLPSNNAAAFPSESDDR